MGYKAKKGGVHQDFLDEFFGVVFGVEMGAKKLGAR